MEKCKENGIKKVEKGIFGAHMEVSLINDGPNNNNNGKIIINMEIVQTYT